MSALLIHTLLDEAASEAPGAPAVTDAHGTTSYADLARLSHACAHWLRRAGLAPGDRLVAQLPSRLEQVALFYGAARAGVVFVPLNPAMKEFHLVSVCGNAEPVLAIAGGDSVARLAALDAVPVRDIAAVWAEVLQIAADGDQPMPDFADDVAPEDVAVLIYTSGSTAAPKAVIGPHAQVVFACRAIQEVLAYTPDDVVFCRFPLSWDYGLYKVLLSCLGRSSIVLAGEESDLRLVDLMRRSGATVVPIVPSLAAMIVALASREAERGNLPPVRMFTNTGAALSEATISALRELFPGVRVVRQFGQTECKRVSIMPPAEDRERPASVGLPLPGTRVLILGENGDPVPVGEVGEIVATGPHVMPGYWRAPEVTAKTFRPGPDGRIRLHTGDYGSVDADGYLYFQGRRDDMFKRKGIRMSVLEIEAAATDIPGVRAAAVLPPSDARDLAVVVESDELTGHFVLKELAQRLEPAKVPARCLVVAELPLTLHGKNSREALAALFEGGRA